MWSISIQGSRDSSIQIISGKRCGEERLLAMGSRDPYLQVISLAFQKMVLQKSVARTGSHMYVVELREFQRFWCTVWRHRPDLLSHAG